MKHSLSVLLAILSLLLLGAVAAAYPDTQELNAAEIAAVEALSDMGVINGYPDGSFRPEDTMTRAEFAKILCQFAAQGELMAPQPLFADVPPQAWYYGWVARAAERGWVKGYPGGSYGPQNTITQQEIATVLARMTGVANADFVWPGDYIAAAEDAGILAGISFKSKEDASRLTACLMLYNLLP